MKKAILVEVTADNSTLLPPAMVQELGNRIWFLRGKDRWEAWKESDLEELLKKEDSNKKKEDQRPLTLPQAIVRVRELADLGYTESIVLNDLRLRVEQLEEAERRRSDSKVRVQP